MEDFNEAARNAYEGYLTGGCSVDQALKKMIPGSKYHDYLKIIDALKSQKGTNGKLDSGLKDKIKNFSKKWIHSKEARRLDYQSLFIEFDNLADDKEQQRKLLQKLSGPRYLKLGLKHKKQIHEGTSEGEKSDVDEDRKKHVLVYSHEDHYKEFLKKIENETVPLTAIHPSVINRINYKGFSDTFFKSFIQKYPHICQITQESFLIKAVELIDAQIKKNKSDTVSMAVENLGGGQSSSFYQRFTLEQLIKIAELYPETKTDDDWHGNVFLKKFHHQLDPENDADFSYNERMDQLIDMYKQSEEMPSSFRAVLLQEILIYGKRLDICYKEYFFEYLKNPTFPLKTSESKEMDTDFDVWAPYCGIMTLRTQETYFDANAFEELISFYLETFYRAGDDLTKYQKFFDKKDYSRKLTNIKLMNGEEVNHDNIDTSEFDQQGNMVSISILESNARKYTVTDKVRILCELKNTPTVYIKMYEFNAENYYRSNK